MSHTSVAVPLKKTTRGSHCVSTYAELTVVYYKINFSSFVLRLSRCQTPHSGRIEQAHNILQQHSSGVHGNPSLCDTGSPLPQRSTGTQNPRVPSEGSFGLGGQGPPGGEGADHALDVRERLFIMCSVYLQGLTSFCWELRACTQTDHLRGKYET